MDCYLKIYRSERNRRKDVQQAHIRTDEERFVYTDCYKKKLVLFLCDQNIKVELGAETWHEIKTVDKVQNTVC